MSTCSRTTATRMVVLSPCTAAGTGAHGATTVLASGRVRYTPATGYSGADQFNYTISDPTGRTDSAEVGVTVQNGAANALLAALQAAPAGSWLRVNSNQFQDVWTPIDQRPSTPGYMNPAKIIHAWSSMAWDPTAIAWCSGAVVTRTTRAMRCTRSTSAPGAGGANRCPVKWRNRSGTVSSLRSMVRAMRQRPRTRTTTRNSCHSSIASSRLVAPSSTASRSSCSRTASRSPVRISGTRIALARTRSVAPDGSQVRPTVYTSVTGGRDVGQPRHRTQPRHRLGTTECRLGQQHIRVCQERHSRCHPDHRGAAHAGASVPLYDQRRLEPADRYVGVARHRYDRLRQPGRRCVRSRPQTVRAYCEHALRAGGSWSGACSNPARPISRTSWCRRVRCRSTSSTAWISIPRAACSYFGTAGRTSGTSRRPPSRAVNGPHKRPHATRPVRCRRSRTARSSPVTGTTAPQRGVLGKWKYAADYDVFFGVISPTAGNVWVYKPVDWSPP